MAAVTQSSSSSASSAQDLLKPDPETQATDQAQDEDEEDLEALRLAALSTIKAKKPAYVVQAHAKNQNLLAIIPVDDKRGGPRAHRRPTPPLPPEFDASVPPPGWAPPIGRDLTRLPSVGGTSSALMGTVRPHRRSPPSRGSYESGSTRGSWSGSNRRSPYRERRRSSPPKTAQESESEYSEYSEYVTDSEAELESEISTEPTSQKTSTERKVRSQMSKESAKNDEDDVLQVDCTDEFTTFLNEFEEELKEDEPATSTTIKKKKRVVKRRKRVKPTSGMNRRGCSPDGIRRTRSPPRRYSRSPYRVRSPYRSRPVSPMGRRRSPSPRHRRSSPGYRPPPRYSRSPRRYSPPSRRRRTPSPHSRDRGSRYSPNHGLRFDHRAGSAPKHEERHTRERLSPRRLIETEVKSRSLPPSQDEPKTSRKSSDRLVNGNKGPPDHENLSVEERSKAEEEREFQAKLKQLPSPERERLLARHAKFAQPLSSSLTAEKKVISLKSVKVGRILTDKDEENYAPPTKLPKRLNSEDGGDSISLSVDDTLDMFQEEKARAVKVTDMRQKLRNKKGAPQPDPQTDLRVQLHQKRRRHVITGQDHLPAHLDLEELSNDKFDESLEHAKLSPSDDSLEAGHSDEEESQSILSRKLHTRASLPKPHKRIVLGGSDENELETRIVKRSATMASLGPSPKKKSVMDRLGEPVHIPSVSISGVMSPSSSPPLATSHHHHHLHRHLDPRRKVISPVERDHDDDEEKSPRDPSAWSSSKIVSKSPSKKDKKKEKREKKEKKKAKKAKKDKKKKKKSTTAQSSDEDDDDDDEERNDHDVQPELNPEEEELFSFFENQTSDI